MLPARHLEILRAQGDLVAALPADQLDALVPTLPDWTVERVVRHLGKVHRWVLGAVQVPEGAGMDAVGPLAGLPTGADCLPAYREAHAALVEHLAGRDPADPAPTFAGPGTVGWWLRRQANEVAVHRVDAHDAIHAAGGPAPVALEADAAADGIDEWATFFLAVRFGQRFGDVPTDLIGRSIHIHGTDDPPPPDGAEWLVTFTDAGVDVRATHAKGDVALRGPAQDLLLALWRRRPLEDLDVVGDAAIARRLLDVATF